MHKDIQFIIYIWIALFISSRHDDSCSKLKMPQIYHDGHPTRCVECAR